MTFDAWDNTGGSGLNLYERDVDHIWMREQGIGMPGLERRYEVNRVNDPAGKHAGCRYFVLDPQHDPIAREALAAYADSARRSGHLSLARDLDAWLTAGVRLTEEA